MRSGPCLIQLILLGLFQSHASAFQVEDLTTRDASSVKFTRRTTGRTTVDLSVLRPRTTRGGQPAKSQSTSSYKPSGRTQSSGGVTSSAKSGPHSAGIGATSRQQQRGRTNKPPRTEAQKRIYNQRRKDVRHSRTEEQKQADAKKEKERVQQRNKGKTEDEIKAQRKAYQESATSKRTAEENTAIKKKYRQKEMANETSAQRASRKATVARNHQERLARMTPDERRKWQDDKNAKAREARAKKAGQSQGKDRIVTTRKRKPNSALSKMEKESSPEPDLSGSSGSKRHKTSEPGMTSGIGKLGGKQSSPEPEISAGAGRVASSPPVEAQHGLQHSPIPEGRESSPALLVDNPLSVHSYMADSTLQLPRKHSPG